MRQITQPQRSLAHLSQRVFNVPLMIHEHKAEVIVAALHERLGVASIQRLDGTTLQAIDMNATAADARRSYENWRPFAESQNVAVIPVTGTLVHKYGHLDPYSGMTGYDGIARKVRAAMQDDEVKAIWLDIDSPGGEVSGCFTLAEEIARMTQSEGGDKPIWAYVDEQACSAAYAIASVCDRIYGPRTMMVGSIGVYVMFVDFSKRLDKEGFTVEIIRAGEQKGRTTGATALTDDARDRIQSMVDDTRDYFADLVAMGRRPAGMTKDSVLATEADVFSGFDALELGLVDDVLSPGEAWELLQTEIGQRG